MLLITMNTHDSLDRFLSIYLREITKPFREDNFLAIFYAARLFSSARYFETSPRVSRIEIFSARYFEIFPLTRYFKIFSSAKYHISNKIFSSREFAIFVIRYFRQQEDSKSNLPPAKQPSAEKSPNNDWLIKLRRVFVEKKQARVSKSIK